jgi:PelA/Pel-15E family pectate lyase
VFRRAPLLSLLALALAGAGALPGAVRWNDVNRQPAAWYASDEARAIAGHVAQYQAPSGGWPKAVDMTVPPDAKYAALSDNSRAPTLDNGGTTTQVRFLAQVVTAGGDAATRAAFERGFDYLLAAQYASGGWPQFFPLREGYYSHITYNDNATANVLAILRDTVDGRAPFAIVDVARRAQAAAAIEKAIACILRTQVKQDGKLTAWCAQHDEKTFAPAWARNFEPPSLSGSESVGLVKFLMGIEQPSPEVIAAIEGAMAWFEASKVTGLRVENSTGPDGKRDRRAVADPAAPVLWARFYELGTNRPLFLGRDKVFRYDFNEIEQERRAGYSYFTPSPADLLAKDYPRWRAKNKRP